MANIPTHIRSGVNRKSIPIHYLVSKDENGLDCWYVLVCPYQKLREMLAEKKLVKPEDYGYVVASGFGENMPVKIREMLAKDYGFLVKEL